MRATDFTPVIPRRGTVRGSHARPWSINWENRDDSWSTLDELLHPDGIFLDVPVPAAGDVHPLAFVPHVPDSTLVFTAHGTGVYYYFDTFKLHRFLKPFESHDDFLVRFMDYEVILPFETIPWDE